MPTLLCPTCNDIGVCGVCSVDMSKFVPKKTLHEHLIKCMQGAGLGPLCMCNKPTPVCKRSIQSTAVPIAKTTHCTTCKKVTFCAGCLVDMDKHVPKKMLENHASVCQAEQLCMCKKALFKKLNS